MKEMTKRQQEILTFLRTHFSENGFWPSIRDIQHHFAFKSTNAVMGHLRALERKNIIQRISGHARAFRIVGDDLPGTPRPADAIDTVDIPIYGNIAAGYPDGVEPGGEIGRLCVDTTTAGVNNRSRAFALKVRGDSMIDAGIYEGDIVILQPGEPRERDIVAALIDGETTLKRFVFGNNKSPYLKAENNNYPELHPIGELSVQGIAKAIVRSL